MLSGVRKKTKNRGFTLLETLVAITVLITGVTGYLTIAHRSVSLSTQAKDQIVASYLAQDAVEYIRAYIREGFINNDGTEGWIDGFDNGPNVITPPGDLTDPGNQCAQGNKCYLDTSGGLFTLGNLVRCPGGGPNAVCPPLRYNPVTGEYSHDPDASWQDSRFTRTIVMTEVQLDLELEVVVIVEWTSGISHRQVVVRTSIFNI